MGVIEKSIEVPVPVRTAYNQWTQFESFPEFMEAVKEVRQLDDHRLHWRAQIGGKELEWDAVITRQEPDRIIAWESTSGTRNNGTVTFEAVNDGTTRIDITIETAPQGVAEKIADTLGFEARQVEKDLERFRNFVRSRGAATGAWRGDIDSPDRR